MASSGSSSSSAPSSLSASIPRRNYMRIKILSLGDSCVGKSCLIKRYCEKKFVPKYISTIGVDFGVRQVNLLVSSPYEFEQETKVNFWDTSGCEEFKDIRQEFYSQAQGVLLVYDVSSSASFQHLDTWLAEAKSHNCNPLVVCVCANKVDEEEESAKKRQVSTAEGQAYATKKGFLYFETSAKTGLNVNELFEEVFKQIVGQVYRSNLKS